MRRGLGESRLSRITELTDQKNVNSDSCQYLGETAIYCRYLQAHPVRFRFRSGAPVVAR